MAETTGQYKSNLTPEEVDQALHNIAQLDDGIAQARQYAEQAQGYAESIDPEQFAPKSHAAEAATYGLGDADAYGHVKLSDTPSNYGQYGGVAATPKCVQDAVQKTMTAQRLTPTWENGFTDSGTTRVWRIGSIIVCQFNVEIPTISSGDWIGILKIPDVNPGTNVNGRIPTVVGGDARDYLVTSAGELRAYLTASDSGNTLNLPLVFVSTI